MRDMKAIEFENVSFSYEEGGSFAIKNLNFSVEEGEFVAVLGHNGSGKSTLARLTTALLHAAGGISRELGQGLHEHNHVEIRNPVGTLPQYTGPAHGDPRVVYPHTAERHNT